MTPDQIKLVVTVVGVVAAVLTLREANRLQFEGAKLFPLGWAIAAFFTLGLSTPVFLAVRALSWLPQAAARQKTREGSKIED